jgi:hypothetical protein
MASVRKQLDKTQANEPDGANSIRLTQRNGSAASWPPPGAAVWPPPAGVLSPMVPDVAPTVEDLSAIADDHNDHNDVVDRIPPTVREDEVIDLDCVDTAPNTIRSGSWDHSFDPPDAEPDFDQLATNSTVASSGVVSHAIVSNAIVSNAIGSGTVPIPPVPPTPAATVALPASTPGGVAPTTIDAPLHTWMVRPLLRERRPHECHYDWSTEKKKPSEGAVTAPPATRLVPPPVVAAAPAPVAPAVAAPVAPIGADVTGAATPVVVAQAVQAVQAMQAVQQAQHMVKVPAVTPRIPLMPPAALAATARPNNTIVLRPLLAASTGPFDVEVIENVPAHTRYRDAVRLGDHDALLIMTDFVGSPALTPAQLSRWKRVVRQAGSRGDSPDAVLQILNRELAEVGMQATATCARLDAREKLINVACAGTEPPFVLRSDRRMVRVQTTSPSVALGRLVSAQFAERSLHFDRGDTLLMSSAVWVSGLETLFAQEPIVIDTTKIRASEWLREQWTQPAGGALLCLTLR